MATTYSYGSSGSKVKKLQDMLGQYGYGSSDASGVYGAGTRDAVTRFQKDYGLNANGVFDQTTLDKLYGVRDGTAQKVAGQQTGATVPSAGTQTQQQPAQKQYEYDPKFGVSENTSAKLEALYNGYQPSETVQKAQANYEQVNAQKPGAYQSQYDGIIKDLYDQITNRKKFNYDVNGDALYEIYKDQYTQGGQQAMMDTMGQAAMLTGGYGNSYASTAGNQAYQQFMTGLADKVPELAQMAQDRYMAEGEDLYNRYQMAANAEQQDYDRYADEYNMWLNQHNTAYDLMKDAEQQDYNRYADELALWEGRADREMQNYWTQTGYEQDAINSNRDNAYEVATGLLASGVMPSEELLNAAGIPQADAQALISSMMAQMAAGGGSSGGGRGGSSSKETTWTTPSIEMYEKALELFNAGGDDGMASYLAAVEKRGYDAADLFDYAHQYGRAPKNEHGGLVGATIDLEKLKQSVKKSTGR